MGVIEYGKEGTRFIDDKLEKMTYKKLFNRPYHPKNVKGHHRCVQCGHLFMHEDRGVNTPPWICNECNPP